MPVEPAQAAAGVHFSLLTTCVAVQTQKYVTPDDIERVLKVLEPAIDGLVKAGYKDRLFVYGFDEQTDSWAKSLYQMYGAIKQRWPFLRTMATLDWQASSPGWRNMPPNTFDMWVDEYDDYFNGYEMKGRNKEARRLAWLSNSSAHKYFWVSASIRTAEPACPR